MMSQKHSGLRADTRRCTQCPCRTSQRIDIATCCLVSFTHLQIYNFSLTIFAWHWAWGLRLVRNSFLLLAWQVETVDIVWILEYLPFIILVCISVIIAALSKSTYFVFRRPLSCCTARQSPWLRERVARARVEGQSRIHSDAGSIMKWW